MSANEDLKELQKSNSEMNVKAEMGYKYKDMYTQDYLEFLGNLCKKYNIDFNKSEIDWEWCNYIQNKQWELEKKIRESSGYKISNDDIIANMTPKEKFKIACRIKNFDIQEMASDIYKIIENSDYEDKAQYLGIGTYEDEYMDEYDVFQLYIDIYMLDTFDDWAKAHMQTYDVDYEECKCMDWELSVFGDEFNEKQRDFINLALECNVKDISITEMP